MTCQNDPSVFLLVLNDSFALWASPSLSPRSLMSFKVNILLIWINSSKFKSKKISFFIYFFISSPSVVPEIYSFNGCKEIDDSDYLPM